MIFVVTGSQKFPFDRLIRAMDELMGAGTINEEVFAQIGAATYEPKHFPWKRFLDKKDFDEAIGRCDVLVTHAGEGSIMTGLLKGKRVIAVPRYQRYSEHLNDHQLQIARALEKQRCILNVEDIGNLGDAIGKIRQVSLAPYVRGNDSIIELLRNFIGD